MVDLRMKELTMMDRIDRGYYWCKIKHADLYTQITETYTRLISSQMLVVLQNEWSTQRNKAMNTYVASYAPKTKTYSISTSLRTRVEIAGAVQILGH